MEAIKSHRFKVYKELGEGVTKAPAYSSPCFLCNLAFKVGDKFHTASWGHKEKSARFKSFFRVHSECVAKK